MLIDYQNKTILSAIAVHTTIAERNSRTAFASLHHEMNARLWQF
jgi:HD superfamily phosphohydrolase YqeK